VEVALQTVAGADAGNLGIRLVDQHVLAVADAVDELAFPPRKDRSRRVGSNTQVQCALPGNRMDPDGGPGVVDDHRSGTPGRREEDKAGGRA